MSPTRTRSRNVQYDLYDDLYILDPEYSQRPSTSTKVYVDAEGRIHDPEYKLFPSNHLRRSSSSSKRTSQMNIDSDNSDQEDSDVENDAFRTFGRRPMIRPSSSPSSSRSSSSLSSNAFYPSTPAARARAQARRARLYPPPTQTLSHPSLNPWTPPPLFEELDQSTHDIDNDTSSNSPVSDSWSLRRKFSKSSIRPRGPFEKESRNYGDNIPEEDDYSMSGDVSNRRHSRRVLQKRRPALEGMENLPENPPSTKRDWDDSVPSCSYSIRRRWQTIVLSVSLSTFRAKRRFRRQKTAVHS
ncbi:hypothetical protein FRC02_009348 [Tulasnella sp. 418]|nr:hypothetical protein FRC02_009348 [Tulasnella sp. 418]